MIDRQTFGPQTAAYYTLGCKLNFAETSTIGRMLEERGIRRARNGEPVDICIINTCSVTELADKKCRQTIRRISRQHPEAVVVVTGCYAQLKPEEIARIPGVDMVLGAGEKGKIAQYLDKLQKKKKPTYSPPPVRKSTISPLRVHEATAHATFSKCKTAATISAHIARYPTPGAEAAMDTSPTLWSKPVTWLVKAVMRSF